MVGKFVSNFSKGIFCKNFFYLSYDMVHFGHANACRQAKQMGGYLIVGVHSDGLFILLDIIKNN
jgi:bifunctional ADP-heptose synthase (sugar kinase/adenylyltransferase)